MEDFLYWLFWPYVIAVIVILYLVARPLLNKFRQQELAAVDAILGYSLLTFCVIAPAVFLYLSLMLLSSSSGVGVGMTLIVLPIAGLVLAVLAILVFSIACLMHAKY
ncbi:MAG: hypothetical protein HKN85_08660 [Gammaproteobacteria bacterium]|nr:hypothetical protein [Gammaproteobacteria bacterium]